MLIVKMETEQSLTFMISLEAGHQLFETPMISLGAGHQLSVTSMSSLEAGCQLSRLL